MVKIFTQTTSLDDQNWTTLKHIALLKSTNFLLISNQLFDSAVIRFSPMAGTIQSLVFTPSHTQFLPFGHRNPCIPANPVLFTSSSITYLRSRSSICRPIRACGPSDEVLSPRTSYHFYFLACGLFGYSENTVKQRIQVNCTPKALFSPWSCVFSFGITYLLW